LDEDDIANANIIVYGHAEGPLLKRFGPRAFFTPGPLARGTVGLLELDGDGHVVIATYTPAGEALTREQLQGRATKLTVSG
ncbi:MAG: hypothetical protein AAF447_27005, partial [Myxococcota bacterium]